MSSSQAMAGEAPEGTKGIPGDGETVTGLFLANAGRYGDRSCLHARRDGERVAVSWRQLEKQARLTALALVASGLAKGDRTAILSENRPEWAVADLGTLLAGAADAPIYATSTPEQCAHVIRDSGARVVFVSGPLFRRLAEGAADLDGLELVVTFEPVGEKRVGGAEVLSLLDFWKRGKAKGDAAELERRIAAIEPDDVLTLIYTSGTTGLPKGVVLTHRNVVTNALSAISLLPVSDEEVFLSFLPLSHAFERTAGYYAPLFLGATIHQVADPNDLAQELLVVKPTVMTSVPRIYEKIHAAFLARRDESFVVRLLIDFAVAAGERASRAQRSGRSLGPWLTFRYALARRLVFGKLVAKLGGRLRFMVSGGAPLAADIAEFFHAAGLLILEGYGLSETGPILTCNRVEAFKFGTVGLPIPGVEIRLADDGEILARGPNIMKEYWRRPQETAEVLREDGWFATGDVGELDQDGFLRITDRKKDLIKTAGGKMVAPQPIEGMLKLQPHIEQAAVVGDRRPYCVAVIAPDWVAVAAWAAENGKAGAEPGELAKMPGLHDLLRQEVDAVNAKLASWETIKRFHVAVEPFTQENDLLTPTLKVRRRRIEQELAEEIDALYR